MMDEDCIVCGGVKCVCETLVEESFEIDEADPRNAPIGNPEE